MSLKDKKILIIHKSKLIADPIHKLAAAEGASTKSAITKNKSKRNNKLKFSKKKNLFKISNPENPAECQNLCSEAEIIFQLIDVYEPQLNRSRAYRNFSREFATFNLNMIDAAFANGVQKLFFFNLDFQNEEPINIAEDYQLCLNNFLNELENYKKIEEAHSSDASYSGFVELDKKMHRLFWNLLSLKIKFYQKHHSWHGAFIIKTKNVFGPLDDFIRESRSLVASTIATILQKEEIELSEDELRKNQQIIYSEDLAKRVLSAVKKDGENFLEIFGEEKISIKKLSDLIQGENIFTNQNQSDSEEKDDQSTSLKTKLSSTLDSAMKKMSVSKFTSFVKDDPLNELKEFSGKFFSIGVIAFFPERIISCLKHLEETCFDPRNFEINIAIPLDPMESPNLEQELLTYKKQSKLEIKIIKTPYDYWTSMHSHNKIIFESSGQNTYFYMNISDRYRFSNKSWDLILKQFIGLVPDDIFFLRSCVVIKNLKPRSSLYEAWYKPDNWAIYTRKYLETIGGFPEIHHAHDGSMEMVHYFVSRNKSDPFIRDIPIPETLLGIQKVIPSSQASRKNFYIRYCSAVPYYLNCYFSKRAIESYKKSSAKIYLNHLIWAKYKNSKSSIVEGKNWVGIKLENRKIKNKISYKVSWLFVALQKIKSLYGKTHGFNFAYRFHFLLKTKIGYQLIRKMVIKKQSGDLIYRAASHIITKIFLCEPITKSILDKINDKDFMEAMQGPEMKKLKKSKLVWIDEMAKIQLMKSRS